MNCCGALGWPGDNQVAFRLEIEVAAGERVRLESPLLIDAEKNHWPSSKFSSITISVLPSIDALPALCHRE